MQWLFWQFRCGFFPCNVVYFYFATNNIYNNDFYFDYKDKEKYLEKERVADEFARTFYIDDNSYHEFTIRNEFNSESITAFAENLHISPDILIGRLQHDHKISYSDFTYMKRKYKFHLTYNND